jgi:elongation factor P--beta-lysine ligase
MSETATWQPSASIPNLLKRAAVMAEIRRFFVVFRAGHQIQIQTLRVAGADETGFKREHVDIGHRQPGSRAHPFQIC